MEEKRCENCLCRRYSNYFFLSSSLILLLGTCPDENQESPLITRSFITQVFRSRRTPVNVSRHDHPNGHLLSSQTVDRFSRGQLRQANLQPETHPVIRMLYERHRPENDTLSSAVGVDSIVNCPRDIRIIGNSAQKFFIPSWQERALLISFSRSANHC